jgi:hypothetical protein
MSKNPEFNRYGYITQGNIPLLSNPDIKSESRERPGILKMLGEMALIVGATAVAGSIARAGTAKAMLSITESAAPWKRALAGQYHEITSRLDDIEGIITEPGLGKISVLDYYRDYKEGLQARGGTGLLKYLPDSQYTKAVAIQRGVAAGRRIPFELPGYYVTNRFIINRDQYEKDVRSGKLDPKNPFDTIGDFAQKAIGYTISDMALSFAAPYAADIKATTINFAKKMPSDKLASSLARFGTLQQAALSDNIAALAKFQERNLVKLEGVSDIFKEYNTIKATRSIQLNESSNSIIDLSLGPIGKLKVKNKFITKDELNGLGQLVTKRLEAYDNFGPGAMFQVGNKAPGQVLGNSFNRVNQEFGILGGYFQTKLSNGSLNYGNHLLVDNLSNKLIGLTRTSLIEDSSIASNLSAGQRRDVFDEALNMIQLEMFRYSGKDKVGGAKRLAVAITGKLNIPASADMAESIERSVFESWTNKEGGLLSKAPSLVANVGRRGIKLTNSEAAEIVEKAYDRTKSKIINLASNNGVYKVGDDLLNIGEEAIRATEKMARKGASEYINQSGFKKLILNDSRTTQNQIAEAALGLFSSNTATLIGKDNAIDVWARSLGTSTGDALDLAKVILKKQGRAVDTFQQSFNLLGLRRMSIEESVGYQKRYYQALDSSKKLDTKKLSTEQLASAVNIYGKDVSYGVRGPGASLFVQTAGRHAKNISAETGLYTTITGKVVDFRSTIDTALRTAQWVGQNMQVPVLKMNPMQMIGADRILERVREPRIGLVRAGTNRTLYEELLSDKDTAASAGQFLSGPMLGVKKHGIAYSWPGQVAENYGRFSLGKNKPSMYQKLARLAHRETRLPGWSRTERGFNVKIGESQFGFGVGKMEGIEDVDKSALRGRFHFTTPTGKRKIFPFDFDVSEDTSGSLYHKAKALLNKQSTQKRKMLGLGRKLGPAIETERYAPNIVNRILNEGDGILAGSKNADDLREIRTFLGQQLDETAQAVIAQGYAGKDFANIGGEVYGDLTKNLNFRGDAGDSFGELAARMRVVSSSTKESATGKSLNRTLDDLANKVDEIAAAAKVRRPTSAEELKGRQLAQNFSMMVSLINGDDAVIKEIEERGLSLFRSRQISPESYASIKAQIASVKLYVSHAAAPPKGGITASAAADALESTKEALNLVLGPRGGAKISTAGGKLNELFTQYNRTVGNKYWMDPDAGIIEPGGAVANIFGRSPENLIAMRPFGWKSGMSRGLEDLRGRAAGSWGASSIAEEDIAFGSAAKGAVFGSGNKLGGNITTGTMVGWHLSSRVLGIRELAGVGLSPHRYSSGMDLFLKGGFLRTALPIYGVVAGIGLAQGIPGIGAEGIGGVAASAVGPGLGGFRAGLGQALNPLPGAVFGSQEFWQTYADVTQSQEDDFARKMARTPEEESAYWQQGDTPVRQGRMWMLGNSPWKGGRVSFYQPNWYRRYMSQYQYTDDYRGSHAEWAMFGTDVSPGKFFDPYHYEKKHYETRPYPVTGDMFTGPWGPLTPVLNATVGAVIKPRKYMHNSPEEMSARDMISTYQTTNGPGAIQLFSSGMMKTGQLMSYPGSSDEGQPFGFSMMGSGGGLSNISTSASAIGAMNRVYGIGSSKTGLGVVMANNVGVGLDSKFIQGGAREQYFRYVPSDNTGQKKGLGYSIGELGYLSKEWAGIYGFAAGGLFEGLGFNKDFTPSQPVLESADRMYGAERSFWDLGIGGLGDLPMGKEGNLELSEVTRRFIPHRRKNITSINNIPNQMPDWMPGPGSLIDFRTGDPLVKIPKGEARLPGRGYERLNELHPDEYGQYGAIDRLKILANVMPWSNEYRYWSQIVSQNMNISDEEQAIVTEAKRQASQRKKKLNLRKKIWSGQIRQYDSTGMEMSGDDPNIFTTASGETVRLAGIRFSSSEVGMSQARDFYNSYLKDQKVELYKDMELDSPLNNRERTTDVIAKVNGINVNEMLLKKIRRGELEGSESRTNNYIDMNLRVGSGWAAFGKFEETLSHLEVPLFKTKFGKYDAEEWLEQKMVYGKQWQPWEKPYESFLRPALDTFTKPDGVGGVVTSTVFTGVLASMFFRPSSAKKIAGVIGGVTGLMMNQQHNVESLLTGQRWVPERRKREAEVEEYMDMLKYVKYTKLYNDARQQAIEKEGIDVEQISDLMGNIKEEARYRQRTAWEEAPVGAKPSKATSNKILESIGPLANQALMYKNKAQATMYGTPLVGDYMATMAAVPKRYRSIFQQLSESPKSRRDDILELLPRGMRRILQAQWGMPIEERPDLDKYFRSHSLPGKNWEGWLPQVNLDEVTIKVIKNEGLDTAEFGYYENEVKNAELMPWATPSVGNDGRSSHDIMTQLSQMGFSDITIRESPLPGIHMNLSLDMTKEIMNSLGY